MKKIIAFFGKKNLIVITILAIIASSVSILSYIYPFFFQKIIENIEEHKIADLKLISLYGGILLLGIILQYFGELSFNKYIITLYYKLKTIILINFLTINDKDKKQYGTGIYQNRINTELDGSFSILNVQTFKSSILLVRLLFALYIGFTWNIYIGIIFTINIIMYIIAAFFLDKKNGIVIKEFAETQPVYNAFILEFLNGITTILNRRIIQLYLKKNTILNTKLKLLSYKEVFNSATITLVFVDIIHILSTVIILAYSLQLYLQHDFSLGKVFATLEYFRYIVDPIDLFNRIYNQYLRSYRYIERLYPIIEYESKNIKNNILYNDIKSTNKIISLKNVTYIYNESILIDNISFDVMKNEKIAIIGRSGEGKSIIMDILLKNITSYKGYAEFMNTDIQKLDRSTILGNIGYYSQDIYIFNDDIINNITNNNIKDTNIDMLINDYGLDNLKGRLLGENGINISKGEKSRIELLRVILNNRELVLLDEPLDGLDSITKEKMIKNINKYLENKTVIIISHDFNLLSKIAEKYILIDNNKIVNIGTHEELYNTDNIYKELYDKSIYK